MDFSDLEKAGSIKPFKAAPSQIDDLIASSNKDLSAASDLLKLKHFGLSRDTAYEAMIKTGMALMFSHGYRPEAGGHHVAIVRFTEMVLGAKNADVIASFDRFRRNRHQRLYQGKETSTKSQALAAMDTAKILQKLVKRRLLK